MAIKNPIPLMCMRSQHRVKLLYLSSIPLEELGNMIGSKLLTLWRTFLTCKYGTLGPQILSDIPISSCRIGIFCMMLLSTSCKIYFTSCPMMFWNCLARLALFTSQEVYCFLFYSTCGMGECELFTMMC